MNRSARKRRLGALHWRPHLEALESRQLLSVTTLGPLVQVSGVSPFLNTDADGVATQNGTNTLNSEVEPSIAVNPTNPKNIVGMWQQDRWSNSGARSNVIGVSMDGGETWQSVTLPKLSLVSGAEEGPFNATRATDPWLTFAADGTLYAMSVVLDRTPRRAEQRGMVVQKSTDGGLKNQDGLFYSRGVGHFAARHPE